jgi:branched-chain amino acid transport system substrate-binding protein
MLMRAAVALLWIAALPGIALAEKRVALVIGNGAYATVGRLDNPKNDAAAMETMFRAAGFDTVTRADDLGVAAMRRALRDFSDTAYDADIAVVFYAGHGIEVAGTNYLIPIDAVLERDIDVQDEAIPLDRINQILERVKRLRLVILDACRDNPFVRSMRRTVVTRSVRSGYGEIDEKSLQPNTLVAYAQRAGATAEDGVGSNSPYTTALIKHLPTPGLDIELALRRVRDDVLKTTRNRQEPFKYGSLGGAEIPLVATRPQPQAAPELTTPARLSEAAEAWAAVKDTTSIAVLDAFVVRFKDTIYADLARARVEDLRKQSVAVAAPPKAPAPAVHRRDLRVGVLLTLSGSGAISGTQLRDGFNLGIKHAGGKLGGLPTTVTMHDDEAKPDVAVGKAKQLIESDKVDFVVGPVFSNILVAISKWITESKVFLISPNAGPSPLAGKGCSPFFFSTSYQNEQPPEALGKYAQDKGYKKVFLLAPNYQVGKDTISGFKKQFKGKIADEVYTPLGQLDFSAELAKIAAAKPDAFFVFMPGGMGVNLVKQYRQAGLANIPFLSVFTVDELALPAQQDAAVGFFSGMTWAPNTDTPQNKTFVADFEKEYGYVPGNYAMQAYDAAQLIDNAVKAAGGKLDNKDALRSAIRKADFKSVRGAFKFNNNGFPVQDFFLVKAAKRPDGKFQTEIVQRIVSNFADSYARECPQN